MNAEEKKYDLEEWLIAYAAEMVGVSEALPSTRSGDRDRLNIASVADETENMPVPRICFHKAENNEKRGRDT